MPLPLIPLAIWAGSAAVTAAGSYMAYTALSETYEGNAVNKIRENSSSPNWPTERNMSEGDAMNIFKDFKTLVSSLKIPARITVKNIKKAAKIISNTRNMDFSDVVYVLQGLFYLTPKDGE